MIYTLINRALKHPTTQAELPEVFDDEYFPEDAKEYLIRRLADGDIVPYVEPDPKAKSKQSEGTK